MGWRFQKRIKINDLLTLNVSKKGVSPSIKLGPITINPKRKTTTVRIPGTGLSYVKSKKNKK